MLAVLTVTDSKPLVNYGEMIEAEISVLQQHIATNADICAIYNPRWLAVTLLEGDLDLREKMANFPGGPAILSLVDEITARVRQSSGEDIDILIADRRYHFIAAVVQDAVIRPTEADYTRSDRIDRVVTHPWLGIPIFLVMMWFVFQMTANVSGIYTDWIGNVISGPVSSWARSLLAAVGVGDWITSLLVDGVIGGAGGMLAFVPVLTFLYLFLAVLEDSGYMARAAFVMDRSMQTLGLHGKSFLPLMIGFGCSVSGIYATRTLEDRRDRILTGLLVPFMSCGARLPVYVLIGTAFFGANSGNLVFSMYLLGIFVAVGSGMLLQHTLLKGSERLPLMMELPPFRRPSFKTVRRQVTYQLTSFIRAIWTIVMFASIFVWVLLNTPTHGGKAPDLPDSAFGSVSRVTSIIFKPAGFGTWEASGSLVTGLVAKEVVVSTMGQIYQAQAATTISAQKDQSFFADVRQIGSDFASATWDTAKAIISILPGVNLQGNASSADDTALQNALRRAFTPLQAVAFSVFVLLYTPCMASVGALRHELGGRWALFSVVYMFGLAWLAAILTYQGGLLLGIG